jgi:hypothetical protein
MKKIALLSLVALAACNETWGPHSMTLNVSEPFQMTSKKKEVVSFDSESQHTLVGAYYSYNKTLTLTEEGLSGKKMVFEFKNISLNQNDNSLMGDQLSTGQNLAVNLKRSASDQNVTEQEYTRSCTYYESRPVWYCDKDGDHGRDGHGGGHGDHGHDGHGGGGHGGNHCHQGWQSYPVSGQERVRETITTTEFQISGAVSQSVGTLGLISGNYSNSTSSIQALSSCR